MPERGALRLRLAGLLALGAFAALTFAHAADSVAHGDARLAVPALVATAALLLAVPRAGALASRALLEPRAAIFVAACAAVAAAASAWVLYGPLHGQVVSLDGAVYLFEARALAHRHLGMPILPPRLPFGVRFLFEGVDGRMHGVFPPGFPLALAPFVSLGLPFVLGPLTAALLVVATYALGRVASGDERVARLAVLVSLPSWGRAIETADLLSHAFVALLFTVALALALDARGRLSRLRAAALGACVAWAFTARLLDGLVLGAIVAIVLAATVRPARDLPRALGVAILAGLPFLTLLAADQKGATGRWLEPTQSAYFERSDYPPTCHRLGFGEDVGCRVEHPIERASFGPDGFGPRDALRVTRGRAADLGDDLTGFAPLLWLAFVPLLVRPTRRDGVLLGAFVALLGGYALFYYGDLPIWGSRHLFPAAPALWVLLATAVVRLAERFGARLGADRASGVLAAALLVAIVVGQRPVWRTRTALVEEAQRGRTDLRAAIDRAGAPSGIVTTLDFVGTIAGYDPWTDRLDRYIVLDDVHGLHELRLLRPELAVYRAIAPDRLVEDTPPVPPPAISIELERAWPSFQRVSGLGARMLHTPSTLHLPSSGDFVLEVFESQPDATLTLPVWVAKAGRYRLRVAALVGPDYGDYELTFDGEPLGVHHGFAPERARRAGEASAPREVTAGEHVLRARCIGKAQGSTGYRAAFDVLVGEPSAE